eukprot:CAMPEP_0185202140 /NCGR_PEP_ID=MMETSP1140-20130426/50516_1 /TAXON_ID=298111 /ORGANISM="Pavlova sp., Strain CCMP459" /LENGTH=142 /DNA_ID=CAMNT_0027769561 /DNA_START=30 /DNA_END=455 /DNA_ORIENTATION=+
MLARRPSRPAETPSTGEPTVDQLAAAVKALADAQDAVKAAYEQLQAPASAGALQALGLEGRAAMQFGVEMEALGKASARSAQALRGIDVAALGALHTSRHAHRERATSARADYDKAREGGKKDAKAEDQAREVAERADAAAT